MKNAIHTLGALDFGDPDLMESEVLSPLMDGRDELARALGWGRSSLCRTVDGCIVSSDEVDTYI